MITTTPAPLSSLPVLDSTMAYREAGDPSAPTALFLHGNPTSSYIWRNVIPHVAPVARCIAPDLIGFGRSGKPEIAYRFADHVRYLDAFIEAAGIRSAYVVAQDWGSALALYLAARRPEFIEGLAIMEFIRPVPTWEEFHQAEAARETFRRFRTPGEGETLILEENAMIERVLAGSTRGRLGEADLAVYREPFPTPATRRPTWRLPNELPIAGEPADVYGMLAYAHERLATAQYPKLLFAGDPGALISPAAGAALAGRLIDCRFVQLPSGRHYLQEEHPDRIGTEVATWISDIEARCAA